MKFDKQGNVNLSKNLLLYILPYVFREVKRDQNKKTAGNTGSQLAFSFS
ncbi:hypothetical protein GYO_2680 [Bacillus spizizenii TU-B-10]|uniref:Uncharacterized protein n=1 Tax=Bacillus spizizenii (strain DSM 15029 / JCM 12233 / NBRC 101239 / NRRL B-23049 / TU-B-10) TaxID=1052585 RepID=G4NQ44_BACS4|nr:hypothetical protein GYO_2680 [Bacillus spizizenii TU-B-10]SCV42359.1 hypothetical protein BQ1740_2973 [Bacillus subtilis]